MVDPEPTGARGATMIVEAGWGGEAVVRASARGRAIVIVDVLSFGTAVDVACGRGCRVMPVTPRNADSARTKVPGALVAGSRRSGGPSLSPASLARLPSGTVLILPSPNGAALSSLARSDIVVAGCFRNVRAVADYLQDLNQPLTLVAAGESDDRGGWRQADEDLWCVGALAAALTEVGQLSPEARTFADRYLRLARPLPDALADTESGKELTARRFAVDLEWAAALNSSSTVPRMADGIYRDVGPSS